MHWPDHFLMPPLTVKLSVIHCLPSDIRLEEWSVPDTLWSVAER
jgi:hypothetical protein